MKNIYADFEEYRYGNKRLDYGLVSIQDILEIVAALDEPLSQHAKAHLERIAANEKRAQERKNAQRKAFQNEVIAAYKEAVEDDTTIGAQCKDIHHCIKNSYNRGITPAKVSAYLRSMYQDGIFQRAKCQRGRKTVYFMSGDKPSKILQHVIDGAV